MINVLKYRYITALFSLIFFGAFFCIALYRRNATGEVFRYSVDFTGGAQILLKFDRPVSGIDVKDALDKSGWEGVSIREFESNEIMIRIKLEDVAHNLGTVAERVQSSIQEAMPEASSTILQSETVGPEVGSSLRNKSIKAVIYALIAILIYISLRFWSLGFAVGAVFALFHDAMMMLAAFLFLNREISINVIGAILAVLGYSINDTIVIFAQIRDNLKKMSHESLGHIVNVSINQTFRRTMLTSISTGLAVLSMLILGGEALRDFSIALLVGIVVGTYSSIYIASPIMMLLYKKRT
jgi:preprotein translocase subunit SecF